MITLSLAHQTVAEVNRVDEVQLINLNPAGGYNVLTPN